MAESVCILEKINLAIKARLEAITVTPGSCAITISAVYRPTRRGLSEAPKDWSVTLRQTDATYIETRSNLHTEWMQEFSLDLNVAPADSSTDAVDTLVNKFRAEIEKAIMSDPKWNDGTTDLAINTYLLGCDRFDGEGEPPAWSGATLRFAVHYRTLETDPYTK